jgi:predicted MFS family arabinose efflux permease
MFGTGVGLGGLELAAVKFAQQHGGTASTGALLATISVGSAIGGACYGHRDWHRPLAAQLLLLSGALTLTLAALAGVSTLPLFAAGLFLTGLFVSPTLIAGYLLADHLNNATARTEASTLINTLNNLGTAVGTALTGLILDHAGVRTGIIAATAIMAITTAAAATRHRRGR